MIDYLKLEIFIDNNCFKLPDNTKRSKNDANIFERTVEIIVGLVIGSVQLNEEISIDDCTRFVPPNVMFACDY